ncbi:MAG: undecaprenyl-phosphate glucose phosphotransferase [Hahellaceae bacterium]|nr:undecaprenyl-phosphate glucose phosphotransferase [Hahellaceae bacterium]
MQRGVLQANESKISLFTRIFDLVLVVGSFKLSQFVLDESNNLSTLLVVAGGLFIYHFLGELSGLYASWRGVSIRQEAVKALQIWALTLVFLIVANVFAEPYYHPNLKVLFTWAVITPLLLVSSRIGVRVALRTIRAHGFNTRTIAIVGSGKIAEKLANHIHNSPGMGLSIYGVFDNHESAKCNGNLQTMIEAARMGKIDRVYIALPMREEDTIEQLIDELTDTTCTVYVVPDILMLDMLQARQSTIGGLPVVSIFESPIAGVNAVLKRTEDIVLSSLILVLIALPMLCIALAVKLTSRGPVIFKQVRYGIDGKPIYVWKFRSMSTLDNGAVVKQATKNDPRLTPIGGFIRRTSLDELPQFINVLQGQMSIVGPRPHAVAHNEEYRKLIKGYMLRHKVKPGITGWAQVNGWRGETDTLDKMEKRVEYDLEYIRHWSLWLDIKIVIMTVFKGFFGKNAY